VPHTSKMTLIAGLGNPLSGDDAFGVRVIERLQQAITELPPDAVLVDAHTDLLNHIEDFAAYERVLLIDAVLDTEGKLGQPGRVIVLDENKFESWTETSQSVHQMSPLLAVKLFRTLYPEARTKITLIGLIVDEITSEPRYATADRIAQACGILRKIL